MLRQNELAFMKAISTLQVSSVLLKELRLAMARRKKKPTVPAGRRSTTPVSGTRAAQQLAGKRKANELAKSGDSLEPAKRRPAPGAGSVTLPATSKVTGKQAAAGSRQSGRSKGGATYAALLAGPVATSKPSGPLKPTPMDSDPSKPGVSMETTNRPMSSDMSGPQSGRLDGTTAKAQVANACHPEGERLNKRQIFISGVSDARSFLVWLQASCTGSPMTQIKGEKLLIVPSTTDGFRAAVTALQSIFGKEGVSFHTFTPPEDRRVRLLVKNLGRDMPQSVVREEPESLNTRVQGVTQLRSGHRHPDPTKERPPIPHFIVSVTRGPGVSKVRSLTELCGLRASVESYVAPKGRCNTSVASTSATRSVTADKHTGASHVRAATSPVKALPRGNSFSALAAEENTQRTSGSV